MYGRCQFLSPQLLEPSDPETSYQIDSSTKCSVSLSYILFAPGELCEREREIEREMRMIITVRASIEVVQRLGEYGDMLKVEDIEKKEQYPCFVNRWLDRARYCSQLLSQTFSFTRGQTSNPHLQYLLLKSYLSMHQRGRWIETVTIAIVLKFKTKVQI